jgi:hypothetical protein
MRGAIGELALKGEAREGEVGQQIEQMKTDETDWR